jgi:RNA polymerase sigma factor (sigma-70 family)
MAALAIADPLRLAGRIVRKYAPHLKSFDHDAAVVDCLLGIWLAERRKEQGSPHPLPSLAGWEARHELSKAVRADRLKGFRSVPDEVHSGASDIQLLSLDFSAEPDYPTLAERLPAKAGSDPDAKLDIAALLAGLPDRLMQLLTLLYFDGLSAKEVGTMMGICEQRVYQLETVALKQLRAKLRRDGFDVGEPANPRGYRAARGRHRWYGRRE